MFTEKDKERAVQAAHFKQATERGLGEIFQKWTALVVCEANQRAITNACNQYCEREVVPTADLLQLVMEDNPDFLGSLARRPLERTKEMLVEDIVRLLRSHGRGHDDFTLRNEARRLQMLTIPELRLRLSNLQTSAKMAAMPLPELKKIVADSRPNQSGFPALPRETWSSSEGKFIPIDSAFLRSADLRLYVKKFGLDQVNSRLQNKG